jgi:conjugative transfer signal peptidase TraF
MATIKVKHLLISAIVTTIALTSAAYAIANAGFVINKTSSMPGFLYIESDDKAPAQVGDVVVICPDLKQMKPVFDLPGVTTLGSGQCHGLTPLMKLVTAAGGDEVSVSSDSVIVEGKGTVLNSGQHDMQTLKQTQIELKHYKLSKDQLFVSGIGSKYSYDSRYFGPITQSNVITKVTKIF